MKPRDWNEIPLEQLNPSLARQVIHTERMTLARIHLRKGALVPRHSHMNEQITLLEQGSLTFQLDEGEHLLGPGQVMYTAPDVAHQVEALEDSIAIDIFIPAREDWIRGDDAYLRSPLSALKGGGR